MKVFVVLIAVCFALANAENIEKNADVKGKQVPEARKLPTAADIVKKIEDLRQDLINKGFNDLSFDNFALPVNSKALGISANILATGKIQGVLDFDFTFKGILNYKYTLNWNKITVDIEAYDLQGFVHMIQVFGAGKLHIQIAQLGISGAIGLFPSPGTPTTSMYIKSLTILITLGEKQDERMFELTGWLNDEVRSTIITNLVNEYLQPILVTYKTEIGATLSKAIKDLNIKIPVDI